MYRAGACGVASECLMWLKSVWCATGVCGVVHGCIRCVMTHQSSGEQRKVS